MSVVSHSQDASRNPHTITRFILQEQKKYPKAKGDLTIILNSVTLAIKIISAAAKGAGIFQRYGMERLKEEALDVTSLPNDTLHHAKVNIDDAKRQQEFGDEEKKDIKDEQGILEFAYDSIISSIAWCGKIPVMLSTINTSVPINVPQCESPKYVLVFDPIDGKQNIEINVSLGTIFGIYRTKESSIKAGSYASDCLQAGNDLVCAGYALYGDATVIMLSFGDEVNGFTLDPSIGEFVLTHKKVRVPENGGVYSINEGYAEEWNPAVKQYISKCKKPAKGKAKKSRYVGCMVADVHRSLIRGGIFMYPPTRKYPNGKLNLQCECNPLAFVVKAAGGRASDGKTEIMDIEPKSTDQRTPIFIGSKNEVLAVERAYKKHKI